MIYTTTKNDMACYIATILLGKSRKDMLAFNHPQVKAIERKHTRAELVDLYLIALTAEVEAKGTNEDY